MITINNETKRSTANYISNLSQNYSQWFNNPIFRVIQFPENAPLHPNQQPKIYIALKAGKIPRVIKYQSKPLSYPEVCLQYLKLNKHITCKLKNKKLDKFITALPMGNEKYCLIIDEDAIQSLTKICNIIEKTSKKPLKPNSAEDHPLKIIIPPPPSANFRVASDGLSAKKSLTYNNTKPDNYSAYSKPKAPPKRKVIL